MQSASCQPLYRCAALERTPLGPGREIVRPGPGTSPKIIPTETAGLLESCNRFDSIENHARAGDPQGSSKLASLLAEFVQLGWMIEKDSWMQSFRSPPPPQPQDTRGRGIESLAIITCNRPRSLEATVHSYASEFVKEGRSIPIQVMDDSRSSAIQQQNVEVLRELQKRHGIPIEYAGIPERTEFARCIASQSSISAEVVDFALLPSPDGGNTCGANRNCQLLASTGSSFLTVDDDTINYSALHPDPDPHLRFSSDCDPCDYWFFESFKELEDSFPTVHGQWLNKLESTLGMTAAGLTPSHSLDTSDDFGSISPDRLAGASGGQIAFVVAGLWGDPGWGAPYGYAGIPLGALLLNDESHERLVSNRERYRHALTSRVVLRASRSLCLGSMRGAGAGFLGINNRLMLPPFPPSGRSQDLLFGEFSEYCLPEVWTAYLPQAVVHRPEKQRSFWPGEHLRTASGVAWSNLVSEAVRSCPLPAFRTTPEARMIALGNHLIEMGNLSSADFETWASRAMIDQANRHLDILNKSIQRRSNSPDFWISDILKYRSLLQEAARRENYWQPLDFSGRSCNLTMVRSMQDALCKLGRLLAAWPALRECSQNLHQSNQCLFRPIHG